MKRRVKRHAVVQPLDPSYKIIPLTKNQNALVDAADFDWLNQWNWYAHWQPHVRSYYAERTENGRIVRMATEILKCASDEEGEHVNNDTLDNRRENLRKCSSPQNTRNRRLFSNNTSGYTGVHWDANARKWRALVRHNGRHVYLGFFGSPIEAARARDEAAKRLHGEFAHLNFSTE